MANAIFVNLPVKDLERSKSFFTALGYSINPQFTDDTCASVVFSDNIYAMLHGIIHHNVYHTGQIAMLREASDSRAA